MEFAPQRFTGPITAFLEDKFLQSSTSINTTTTSSIDFNVTSDTASASAGRFRIVFKNSLVLPVTFSSLTAQQDGSNIATEWKVENEINISRYELEKSTDGRNFTRIYTTTVTGNINNVATYHFTDREAVSGDNFYRVKSIGNNGTTSYSRIVKVTLGKISGGFVVYPNPVTDNVISLQISNVAKGIYNTRLLNDAGQLISKNNLTYVGGNSNQSIVTNSNLISGVYQLQITGPDKKTTTIKVLVKN